MKFGRDVRVVSQYWVEVEADTAEEAEGLILSMPINELIQRPRRWTEIDEGDELPGEV